MSAARSAHRRAWPALAWGAGGAALFALFLRISLADAPTSDPANNALQAWDMLHGHLLLHGWILGDATFYTFELPLIAVLEIFFGLNPIVVHVAEALVYLLVAALAVAIAVTGSRGAARAARAGVVAAVLAAPTLILSDLWIPLGFPDHTGTTVFILLSFLLVDLSGPSGGSSPPEPAFPDRWLAAPLVCAILCAGQLSDVTVRYVAVPAIVAVCGYRALAARAPQPRRRNPAGLPRRRHPTGLPRRRNRAGLPRRRHPAAETGDAANLVAALVSVPLSLAIRALLRHLGGYLMVAPKTGLEPPGRWPHNAALTWYAVCRLFGIAAGPGARPVGLAAIFGTGCLLVATAGAVRVAWRWRTARRAEQLLLVAIVINIAAYTISALPTPRTPHDLVTVLPAGAILGARALVPDRLTARRPAAAAVAAAALAALLPLSLAATRPPQTSPVANLTAWLEAHGLRYGLAGYWDASAVTLQSAGRVQVRTVEVNGGKITPFPWETNTLWFDPAEHYANFVIIGVVSHDLAPAAERFFGSPISAHRVGGYEVLSYDTNVLRVVRPPVLPPTS